MPISNSKGPFTFGIFTSFNQRFIPSWFDLTSEHVHVIWISSGAIETACWPVPEPTSNKLLYLSPITSFKTFNMGI